VLEGEERPIGEERDLETRGVTQAREAEVVRARCPQELRARVGHGLEFGQPAERGTTSVCSVW